LAPRRAVAGSIVLRGAKAACLGGRLSSNVRPQTTTPPPVDLESPCSSSDSLLPAQDLAVQGVLLRLSRTHWQGELFGTWLSGHPAPRFLGRTRRSPEEAHTVQRCASPVRPHRVQRGSCDAPCDLPCDGDCNLDCGKPSRYASCCDGCSCDWPERKNKHKRSEEEKYVYLPPRVGKP